MITSKSNATIKRIKKLLSSAKERKQTGTFVIEGLRLVKEAPPEAVEELFVSESFSAAQGLDLSLYQKTEVIADDVYRSLSDTVSPQGVLAVVRMSAAAVDVSKLSKNCRLLLLDDMQDPGNLGTVFRTAEAAGVDAVFMSKGCVDLYNPKVIRSTMGSIFRVPYMIADLASVIARLKEEGITVYGAALEEATDYRSVSFPDALAIVIGNEGNGISPQVLHAVDRRIHIPMVGKVESLNAAVSAAVLLFHVKK